MDIDLIWGIDKAEYFFAQDWTTQISLKRLENFRFWCGSFCGSLELPETPSGD
jgi:hypothetical protein